jgi:hypothetical protein
MKKLHLLTHKIAKHFSIHKSRQKTLAAMILSALSTKNVHQQSLSLYVEGPNPKAALRKVERFFVTKLCPTRIMLRLLSISLVLKRNSIFALTDPIGSLGTKTSITLS